MFGIVSRGVAPCARLRHPFSVNVPDLELNLRRAMMRQHSFDTTVISKSGRFGGAKQVHVHSRQLSSPYSYSVSLLRARIRELSKRQPSRAFRTLFRRQARHTKSQMREALSSEQLSLTQRFKKLSKEYGWVAVGVYLSLSILDFPFCFLLVRAVGTEKIGEMEHWIVSKVRIMIPETVCQKWHEFRHAFRKAEKKETGDDQISESVDMATWGVEEAEKSYRADASLATQLALAYAIHKSFIFVRIPLTMAITPRVVKVLRRWGWQIGKRKNHVGGNNKK